MPTAPDHDPAAPAEQSPMGELMWLALPTILQMLAYTIEQFTDALMLARVSDLHATACGNAGMVAFAIMSFGFGVLMLVNALVSEEYGARRHAQIGSRLWQGIWFAVLYSVLLLPTIFAAPLIFNAMGHSAALVPLEVEYFNVTIAWLGVKMLAIAVGQFMLAVNRPMVVFVGATAGMLVNIGVNWLLIYGNWGFPRMGVAGAAWGTNAAVLTELLIVAGVAFAPRMRATYGLLAWRFHRTRFAELIRIGVPSGFQTVGDVVAWTIFLAVVMASFGPATQAANVYMMQYMKLLFMPAFGLSAAVTALVARHVGAGRPDVSEQRANLGFRVATVYMISLGLLFVAASGPLMRVFSHDAEVIRVGRQLFVFCAVFQLFDAMFVIYSGALRGVRDTFVPALVQIALGWSLLVCGGLGVVRLFPQWGAAGPWSMACLFVIVLGSYLMHRFRAGKWKVLAAARLAV